VENQLRVLYAFAVAWLGGHTRGVIMSGQETFQPGRRDLGKLGLGSVMGAPVATRKAKAAVHPNGPGIKLCAQSGFAPTDEQLLFLKQIGAQHAGSDAQPAGARPEDRQGQPVWHAIYAVASIGTFSGGRRPSREVVGKRYYRGDTWNVRSAFFCHLEPSILPSESQYLSMGRRAKTPPALNLGPNI
jgi:hypothetical protein